MALRPMRSRTPPDGRPTDDKRRLSPTGTHSGGDTKPVVPSIRETPGNLQKGIHDLSRVRCMYPRFTPWRQPTPKRIGASTVSPLCT